MEKANGSIYFLSIIDQSRKYTVINSESIQQLDFILTSANGFYYIILSIVARW